MNDKGRGGSNLYEMNGTETPEIERALLIVSEFTRAGIRPGGPG